VLLLVLLVLLLVLLVLRLLLQHQVAVDDEGGRARRVL